MTELRIETYYELPKKTYLKDTLENYLKKEIETFGDYNYMKKDIS